MIDIQNQLISQINEIMDSSWLSKLFQHQTTDLGTRGLPHSRWRAARNTYRIWKFELWKKNDGLTFRILHAREMPEIIKIALRSLGAINFAQNVIDYRGENLVNIAASIFTLLDSPEIKQEASETHVLARDSRVLGLDLPDVDTDNEEIFCVPFSWKQIIKIWEDNSEENQLKKKLMQNGVYLQRSKDGQSRYVGSAYGEGGIIGRWMKHLTSNGHAQHLNLFILDNGYNSIEFVVLEVYETEQEARNSESKWKIALATRNNGIYDGIRLNCN